MRRRAPFFRLRESSVPSAATNLLQRGGSAWTSHTSLPDLGGAVHQIIQSSNHSICSTVNSWKSPATNAVRLLRKVCPSVRIAMLRRYGFRVSAAMNRLRRHCGPGLRAKCSPRRSPQASSSVVAGRGSNITERMPQAPIHMAERTYNGPTRCPAPYWPELL